MKKSVFALMAVMALSSSAAFAASDLVAQQLPVLPVAADHPAPPPGVMRGDHPGQPGQPGEHAGKHHRGGFAQDLNLTKEQRGVLHQTMREEMGEQKSIVGSYLGKLPKAEQGALAAELKASHDKQVAKFLAVLTPEQKVKAEEKFKNFAQGPGHQRGLFPVAPEGKAPGAVPPPPAPATVK
jgi:Spy/CpxP family protein refolding chaperone